MGQLSTKQKRGDDLPASTASAAADVIDEGVPHQSEVSGNVPEILEGGTLLKHYKTKQARAATKGRAVASKILKKSRKAKGARTILARQKVAKATESALEAISKRYQTRKE